MLYVVENANTARIWPSLRSTLIVLNLGSIKELEDVLFERIVLYWNNGYCVCSCNELYLRFYEVEDIIVIFNKVDPQHNLESLIVEGLKNMQNQHCKCIKYSDRFPIDNSHTFAWTLKWVAYIISPYSASEHVEFYCNVLLMALSRYYTLQAKLKYWGARQQI